MSANLLKCHIKLCPLEDPGISFLRTCEASLWNVNFREDSTPASQFLWERRSLILVGCLVLKLPSVIKMWEVYSSFGQSQLASPDDHLNYQVSLGWTLCDKWYIKSSNLGPTYCLSYKYCTLTDCATGAVSYCLSWEHVCNGLYLFGWIQGWDLFLSLQSFRGMTVAHITFWSDAHSVIELFSFLSPFAERFFYGWQEILFLITFPQHLLDMWFEASFWISVFLIRFLIVSLSVNCR